jgi:hypothetical protein
MNRKLYGKFGVVERITRYNLIGIINSIKRSNFTTPEQLFEHCSDSNTKIHFIYISKEAIICVRENLKDRFNSAKTVSSFFPFLGWESSSETFSN